MFLRTLSLMLEITPITALSFAVVVVAVCANVWSMLTTQESTVFTISPTADTSCEKMSYISKGNHLILEFYGCTYMNR